MKIIKNVLIEVLESDLINGHFENNKVTELADYCLSGLKGLKSVTLKKVKTFGSDCLSYNHALTSVTLPAATTFGSYCLRSNQALTSVTLRKQKFNTINVDGYCFVPTTIKTTKGIKIMEGFNITSMKNKVVQKESCFVAQKDGFSAHGETAKKAITDLLFKVNSDKLKKEPITPDTMVTIDHYRLITGSCEFGCKSWIEANIPAKNRAKVIENGIKAKDILPILEKTNAYGFQQFKKLVTF